MVQCLMVFIVKSCSSSSHFLVVRKTGPVKVVHHSSSLVCVLFNVFKFSKVMLYSLNYICSNICLPKCVLINHIL